MDISNQSSKKGIRIVIEVRKDTDVDNFINMLYKKTRLEDTFGVNMLAIHNGRPETMGLKAALKANVDFQYEVCRRKYTTLLNKELEKKEIQEVKNAYAAYEKLLEINPFDIFSTFYYGSKEY